MLVIYVKDGRKWVRYHDTVATVQDACTLAQTWLAKGYAVKIQFDRRAV